MKYVFLGSGLIANRCLREILSLDVIQYMPSGIVCDSENLNLFKSSYQIPELLLSQTNKNESILIEFLRDISPDFIISVQYPWILSKSIIDMVSGRAFNIHNAKLPNYRGHNSLTYEILNNEKTHVSTLHQIDEVVDRGRIIKTQEVDISSTDTAFSLWKKSLNSCVDLFRWFVVDDNYLNIDRFAKPIEGEGCYYSKHQIKLDKHIHLTNDVELISRYARAFYFPPHEPAYFLSGDMKIYLSPKFDYNISIKAKGN